MARTRSEIPEEAERSALLSAILNTVRDGIITVDEQGLIVMGNEAVHRMFGYESGQLPGKPLSVLMPHDYRDRHRAGFGGYLKKRTEPARRSLFPRTLRA